VDRTNHDLIVYEKNTDPEHQLVIIGHEAWHMFNGHCGSPTAHGSAASRAGDSGVPEALADAIARISEAIDTDLPLTGRMDAALHFAARTDSRQFDEEVEAEFFGFWFATDMQEVLNDDSRPANMQGVAERIQVSMAHRFRGT
jgi:hypothetical protein